MYSRPVDNKPEYNVTAKMVKNSMSNHVVKHLFQTVLLKPKKAVFYVIFSHKHIDVT